MINTETQYDNIKFAQLFFFLTYHSAVASSKQKTFFFFLKMINSI